MRQKFDDLKEPAEKAIKEIRRATRAERLLELEINDVDGFFVTSYTIETGNFYRW